MAALPDDDHDNAALHEIMHGEEGEGDAADNNSSWVRRSTRPAQAASGTLTEPTTNAAAATTAAASSTSTEQDATEKMAPSEEKSSNPRRQSSSKRYKKKQNDGGDTVQLFAFDNPTKENCTTRDLGGRPKRKLKSVARFDSQSFEAAAKTNCKAGHGFSCPRCSSTCSYTSRSCVGCGLECYYEAGVGVVVLKERHEMQSVSPKKRNRRNTMDTTTRPTTTTTNATNVGVKAKKRGSVARGRSRPPTPSRGGVSTTKKSAKKTRSSTSAAAAAAFAAAKSPSSSSDAKPPPENNALNCYGIGSSHAMGGKTFGKRLLLPPQAPSPASEDHATTTANNAMDHNHEGQGIVSGGHARPVVSLYEKRPFIIKEYASLDDARKDLGISCKTIREKRNYNQEHAHGKKRNKGKFMHYDFRDYNDIRTSRRWARELSVIQNNTDFDDCDSLTAAREYPSWNRHLADAQYRMFMGRRILTFMRDTRKVGSNLVRQNGGGGKSGKKFGGKTPRHQFTEDNDEHGDEDEAAKDAIVATIRGKEAASNATADEATTAAINEHLPGEAMEGPAGLETGHLGEHDDLGHFGGDVMAAEHTSEEHDMNMVNELNVDFPPEDHPPGIVDGAHAAADMTTMTTHETEVGDDLDLATSTKLQENMAALQSVTEEKKDIQAKYDNLLSNSIKTEGELRDTISTLTEQLKGEDSNNKHADVSELKDKLAAVSTERDDLAKKVDAMAAVQSERDELAKEVDVTIAMQSERDELAQKLEETNAKLLEAQQENAKKDENATNNTKEENESLTYQVDEATSKIDELTNQLLTTMAEKADAEKKLGVATSDLSAMREEAQARTIKITNLESSMESLTAQRDAANLRVSELLAGNANADGVLSSLMSERDGLASSVEESKRMITRLETENVGSDAKATSLENMVEELQGRIESLSAELNASKYLKPSTVTGGGCNLESVEQENKKKRDAEEKSRMQSDFADREAKYKSTIATLEDSLKLQHEEAQRSLDESVTTSNAQVTDLASTIDTLEDNLKRQNEEAQRALDESVTASNAQVADITSQISKLTAERDTLAVNIEEATSELSELQSTFETLNAERDAAEAKVRELLSGNAHTEEVMAALNSEKDVLISKIEECIARLYSEKDEASPSKLKHGSDNAEMHQHENSSMNDPFSHSGMNGSSSKSLEALENQLQDKDAEVSKLIKDKQKLESYTKQTLQIFQQKYFATTQDYKAQLKEKTQRIQALETKLADRKKKEGCNSDERDPPLPSSSIYELDLGDVHNVMLHNAAGNAADHPTSDTTAADESSELNTAAERKSPTEEKTAEA